jgi:hypothetical protein
MNLIEMDGFLRRKCIPGDMLVNESNAEYLVRKFQELSAQRDALAAENAGLKSAKSVVVKVAGNLTRGNYFDELQTKMNCHVSVQTTTAIAFMDEARETMKQHAGKLIGSHNLETPATDAFLAEVRASAIEHAASERWGSGYVFDELNEFAAQIRGGGAE